MRALGLAILVVGAVFAFLAVALSFNVTLAIIGAVLLIVGELVLIVHAKR